MAWRGEILYVATMQSFFGTRKTLRTLFFVSKRLRSNVWTHVGPMQCLNMSEPLLSGPNHGQEHREKEEQETEVRCWLWLHETVKSVLMSLSMLEKCSNVCVIAVDLTNVSSQVQITSPTFSNHTFEHTFKKNDKAVNVNQLVSHVPDYHNKSSLNAFINDIKTKCIRMYNYV